MIVHVFIISLEHALSILYAKKAEIFFNSALLQIELAGICFGISSFLRRGSIGAGLGVAVTMYFLNLIANITESAEFLKYFTPFAYANGTDIVTDVTLDGKLILIGMTYAIVGIVAAYWKYTQKDIA